VPRDSELPSERVFAALKDKIESGELQPGEQMPSLRKISEDYSVSQTTARKVIDALAREGLVEIKPRWGSFVR
jgi:DNA-binding GntR family transcriptional regulator